MPELPDITVYLEALEQRIHGATLKRMRLLSPFLLRTVQPAPAELEGQVVKGFRRIGKRIAIGLSPDYWLVLHLMIAGRLHWRAEAQVVKSSQAGAKGKLGKNLLAEFEFSSGLLTLTEAGSKKRASLHVVKGENALLDLDPGGIEVLESTFEEFQAALIRSNHTLKRALTDPRIFSGIGNAYSDEILHLARMSPITLTQKLSSQQASRLFEATNQVMREWIDRLRQEAGGAFPERVTAFREGMAVHGRYGEACPRCGGKVQRIRYADNETNYCPACQTNGKLLADRSLSRLLGADWPKTLEEMEVRVRGEG